MTWFSRGTVPAGLRGETAASTGTQGVRFETSTGVAYAYSMSKRTNLYATYGRLKNEDGANFALRAAGGGVAGPRPTAFALGIRHRF